MEGTNANCTKGANRRKPITGAPHDGQMPRLSAGGGRYLLNRTGVFSGSAMDPPQNAVTSAKGFL